MYLPIEFFAASGIINGVIALAYGSFILLRKKNSWTSTTFFLMTLSVAVWGISYWKWLSAENIDEAIFWVRVLSIGSFFIPVFYLHWFFHQIGDKYKRVFSKLFLYIAYISAISSSLLIQTTYIIDGMERKLFFPFWPNAGFFYTIVIAYLYLFIPIYTSIIILNIRKFESEESNRSVLNLILIGTIVGFGSGLTNFPLWYNIPLPPYGTFFNAIFPVLFGYGSIRHKFFDIKAIGAELLIAFIIAVLFVETLLSQTKTEYFLRSTFLFFVGVLSFLLIKSIHKEVENREKGEKLARYLANANARLRELDKQKTEFVSIASHQLRAPIAAIKGYTSMITEGSFGKVPKNLNEPLNRISESGQRIGVMVDDFLNVTRIEQGRMIYNMAPQNVHSLLESVVNELKVVSKMKGLELFITPESNQDCLVHADEGKLKQIFSNLIDNSIKYTPQGWIHITVLKMVPEKKILVKIQDTGIGIAPDEVQNLFQKFNRASNANEENVLGTGLGLYIAREILKAHDGWINVESEGVGKGSTFIVELPACDENVTPSKEEK